jgi:hypothetical protein
LCLGPKSPIAQPNGPTGQENLPKDALLRRPNQIHPLPCELHIFRKYQTVNVTWQVIVTIFFQLCFSFLLGGTIYILVNGENTFIGQ